MPAHAWTKYINSQVCIHMCTYMYVCGYISMSVYLDEATQVVSFWRKASGVQVYKEGECSVGRWHYLGVHINLDKERRGWHEDLLQIMHNFRWGAKGEKYPAYRTVLEGGHSRGRGIVLIPLFQQYFWKPMCQARPFCAHTPTMKTLSSCWQNSFLSFMSVTDMDLFQTQSTSFYFFK